jgi:hypothetical protein
MKALGGRQSGIVSTGKPQLQETPCVVDITQHILSASIECKAEVIIADDYPECDELQKFDWGCRNERQIWKTQNTWKIGVHCCPTGPG